MPERFEGQEKPKMPERDAEHAERRVEGAEVVEQAVDEAVDSVDAKADAFASVDVKRVMAPADVPASELAGDAAFTDAQKEVGAVQDEARGLVGRTKDKLSGVLAKLKRYGRAGLAAGVIAGAAFPASEAAAHEPGPGPKIEHVEKGPDGPAAPAEVRREAADRLLSDAAMKSEFVGRYGSAEAAEAKLKEFAATIEGWDEEASNREWAALGGIGTDKLVGGNYRKMEVWSEARHQEELANNPNFPKDFNAWAENDVIVFKASSFLGKDGAVDVAKLRHAAEHEKGHVLTTAERTKGGEQQRLWDKEGVAHGMNEGVTELLSLRLAERRGEKVPDQAYAGGNFAAARLLEGVVGTDVLAADYLEGKTDRIKDALEKKLGPGSFEKVMEGDFPSLEKAFVPKPDALSNALDIVRLCKEAGVDAKAIWEQAKREGVREDLVISPDGRGVAVVKDVGGELRVANAAVDDDAPLSADGQTLRAFVGTTFSGTRLDGEGTAALAAGLQERMRIEDAVKKEWAAKFDLTKEPEMRQVVEENVRAGVEQAVNAARAARVNVADTLVPVDASDMLSALQKEYSAAATPEAKAAIRAKAGEQTLTAARDAIKKIRLEMLTPPIPEKK